MSALISSWALVAALFSLVALWRLERRGRGVVSAQGRRRPSVLLLRPVDAPTALELRNLDAPIDYPGEVTHVVLSPSRPRLQSTTVRWLPSDPLTLNRKVGHLVHGLATQPRDADTVVACVDADVRVDGALLCGLVDELLDGAALASAPPMPAVSDSLAGRALRGLLVQSHHSFQALDVMSAGAKTVCGKALALAPSAQAMLARLGDCIGEDLELSVLMHERGLPVTMTRSPAQVPQPAQARVRGVVDRFTRWMQVLRAHRPALFPTVPLFLSPTPLVLVLAALVGTPEAGLSVGVLVAARWALASRLDRRPGQRFEWLLGETLLLVCWLEALRLGRWVTWRGRRFELRAGGRIEALAEPLEEGAA